jgi:hypothetical protein
MMMMNSDPRCHFFFQVMEVPGAKVMFFSSSVVGPSVGGPLFNIYC